MCLTECDGLFGERRTGAAVKTDSIQTASSVVVMSTSHLEKFAPIICTFLREDYVALILLQNQLI